MSINEGLKNKIELNDKIHCVAIKMKLHYMNQRKL